MGNADEQHRNFVFSFGLERLGLVALKAPVLVAVLVAIATVLGLIGILKLQVDDSLSELFRTNTEEFRRYEAIDKRFPSSEYDVLVVVEGPRSPEAQAARSLRRPDDGAAARRWRLRPRLHVVGARQAGCERAMPRRLFQTRCRRTALPTMR